MIEELVEKVEKIKQMPIEELCVKFNCKPKEICMGNYIARETNDKSCPYKVVLGYADFEGSEVGSLGKLEIVYGKPLVDLAGKITDMQNKVIYLGLNLKNSQIRDLGKLRRVYGSLTLNENITSLSNLEFVGSNLYLNKTKVEDLGNLEVVVGRLNLEDLNGRLTSLKNLKRVGAIYINTPCLRDLGKLEEVNRVAFGRKVSTVIVAQFNDRFPNKHMNFEANLIY